MIKEYSELQSVSLKPGSGFARPVQNLPERVKLGDPALSVMTDLAKVSLVTTRAKTSMDKANAKMVRYGVRMLLVLDDNEELAGLLTATDILGEKPVHFLQNMGGTHDDIMVRDIMSTLRELTAMRMMDVEKARVGDIVASLKKVHRQHALVVSENPDGKQVVCGLFSITQIARQLGIAVQNLELASTFAEIENAVSRA